MGSFKSLKPNPVKNNFIFTIGQENRDIGAENTTHAFVDTLVNMDPDTCPIAGMAQAAQEAFSVNVSSTQVPKFQEAAVSTTLETKAKAAVAAIAEVGGASSSTAKDNIALNPSFNFSALGNEPKGRRSIT